MLDFIKQTWLHWCSYKERYMLTFTGLELLTDTLHMGLPRNPCLAVFASKLVTFQVD